MDMFDTVTASENGAWVHLTNAKTGRPAYLTGEDGKEDQSRPCRIRVLGEDSPTLKQKAAKRAAAMVKRRGTNTDLKKMSEAEIIGLMEEGEQTNAETLADATMGWENLPLPEDIAEFNHANAVEVYTRYPSIMREVSEFRKSEANFFG